PPVARTPTPPKGQPVRKPTPAKGEPVRIPPRTTDPDTVARGPTQPPPVAEDVAKPAERAPSNPNRLHPRGNTPPAERLIVPKAERAEAEAQLDQVFAGLTVDREWGDDGDEAAPPGAQPHVPSRATTDEPEIIVEGDDPRPKKPPDQSEPEIS